MNQPDFEKMAEEIVEEYFHIPDERVDGKPWEIIRDITHALRRAYVEGMKKAAEIVGRHMLIEGAEYAISSEIAAVEL